VSVPIGNNDPSGALRVQEIHRLLQRPASLIFAEALDNARKLGQLVDEHLAYQVAPAFNKYLGSLAQKTHDDKKAVCIEANEYLREMRLAIKDEKTGRPGILTASPDSPPCGRFRVRITCDDGTYRLCGSHNELPPFDLIPAPLRRVRSAETYRTRTQGRDR
jgi:hypothetical protein